MAYLEKGHTFDEIVAKLAENHPQIKNIRAYARNAIRQTTGDGLYDNYIFAHGYWVLRNPILAEGEDLAKLEKMWKKKAEVGRELIEMRKTLESAYNKGGETRDLIELAFHELGYVYGRKHA